MSNKIKSLLKMLYSAHESDLNQSAKNRFEYLNGYRGFLALLVVMQHFQGFFNAQGDYLIFRDLGKYILTWRKL